jgi:two-component system cell cycle sensor histidine kinase/response regulator CckA
MTKTSIGRQLRRFRDLAGELEAVVVNSPARMAPVRISLFYCSEDEILAIRRELAASNGELLVVLENLDDMGSADPFDCDAAVIGAFAITRHAVLTVLREKLQGRPAILVVRSAEENPLFAGDFAAIARSEMHVLPYVIHREVKLHRTEVALRQSEARYRRLIDSAQEGVWVIDTTGRTTFANRKLAELFGCSIEELMTSTMFDYMDADAIELATLNMSRRGAGIGEQHDFRFRRKDGRSFWALLSTSPLFDEQGRYTGSMALVTDITARKAMEEELVRRERALQESEARYRNLVANIPDVIVRTNAHGRFIFATANIEEMTGFTVAELLSGGLALWSRRVHPADVEELIAAHHELYSSGSLDAQYRFLRADGRWIWLHERAVVSDDAGTPQEIGVISDITSRRDAEEALRKSEDRYRSVVEQATDIIFSVDMNGVCVSLNKAFETLTGFRVEDWIGRHFVDLLHPGSVERGMKHFHAVLSGAPPYCEDYRLRTKAGDYLTVETTAQAIVVDGQAAGTVGIARDVTRRKEAESEAEKEKRLASLGHLAASVAHEFNNVLMSILPFAELIRRRAPDDARTEVATKHIIQAIRRGRQVSQEILRLARPAPPSLVAVDAGDWLVDFVREAQAMLGPKYRVTSAIDPPHLLLRGDRALIDQVATNLVLNARDAMADGGHIRITVSRRTNDAPLSHEPAGMSHVEIGVHDNGPGIPPELIDRVFDPLFTTKQAGTGLGLSIAHQAMMQQDGALRVQSVFGEGTTFSMIFRETEVPEPAVLPEARPKPAPRRILLVEDDDSVGEGLRALLIDEGFEVRLVARGRAAAPAVLEFSPDLVLLDVNLPDVSGVDVFEELRQKWPDLSIIFSTGHTDGRALEEVRARRVPSIMKPYDVDELLNVMAQTVMRA